MKTKRTTHRINTGCRYSPEGQLITLLIEEATGAFFCDHSRGITGYVEGQNLKIADVICMYTRGNYREGYGGLTQEEKREIIFNVPPPSQFENWSGQYRDWILNGFK